MTHSIYLDLGDFSSHQTEWAKLLLILHRHIDEPWLVTRAKSLFDETLSIAWDQQHSGIFYGFAPDKQICDSDKYFWVQAESLAAAALLADATNDESYWQWYEKIWLYSWQHIVITNMVLGIAFYLPKTNLTVTKNRQQAKLTTILWVPATKY